MIARICILVGHLARTLLPIFPPVLSKGFVGDPHGISYLPRATADKEQRVRDVRWSLGSGMVGTANGFGPSALGCFCTPGPRKFGEQRTALCPHARWRFSACQGACFLAEQTNSPAPMPCVCRLETVSLGAEDFWMVRVVTNSRDLQRPSADRSRSGGNIAIRFACQIF